MMLSLSAVIHAEQAEEGMLPLPRWSEQELKAFRESPNGPGVLLPETGGTVTDINELLGKPLPIGPRLDHSFSAENSELLSRLRPEDMGLFLPSSILGQSAEQQPPKTAIPTPLTALRDVPPEFLTAGERALPTDYLIDPGLLAPEIQNHDMLRFLEFHARDARIKLYVLILGHDRKLPAGADLGKIASGSLLQSDSCLLAYPLGEPWRARLFVSQSVHDRTSTEFLSETIQACLSEAMQASDVHDQLHRYAVHLSTRLFWLQKALGSDLSTKEINQPLAEVASMTAPSNSTAGQEWKPVILWSLACLALLVGAGLAASRFHLVWRLRQRNHVWLLPDPDTAPRLGGAFTGGGGGMLRYS